MPDQSDLDAFLTEFPLKSKWLDDIITVLLRRPNGTAHVSSIGRDLWGERYVDSMDQTITRTINNFCSDAKDWHKTPEYDIFKWVEAATYRLRSHPNRPEIIELVRVEFDDADMNYVWKTFCDKAKKKDAAKWNSFGTSRRLSAFAANFRKNPAWRNMYNRLHNREGELEISN
jgi:hypothetical protein